MFLFKSLRLFNAYSWLLKFFITNNHQIMHILFYDYLIVYLVRGRGWDEIHESFSFQREDAASCGWHFLALGLQKRRTRWEGDEPNYWLLWLLQLLWLFSLFQVRVDNCVPENAWVNKRNSIAKEIRDLGAGYSQILRDGWVHYLLQKDAAGGVGQAPGSSKQPWKTRLLLQMKRSFCCR